MHVSDCVKTASVYNEGLGYRGYKAWAEVQTRLWSEWESMLNRAHRHGVVSDAGLNHLRNRENVIRENWGCKP